MNKILISITAIVLSVFDVDAQISNEIKNFKDTTENYVNNGRKLLVQKIEFKDIENAKKVYQYLNNTKFSDNTSIFNYSEHLHVNILLGDWRTLSLYMRNYKDKSKVIRHEAAAKDLVLLFALINSNSDSLINLCKNSTLDEESKALITIFIHLIGVDDIDEFYKKEISNFKKRYKSSKYNDFINNYLPVQNNWYVLWTIGPGLILPTNKLSDYFSSNPTLFFTFDFKYLKYYATFYVRFTDFVLKKDINTTYLKNEKFVYQDVGINAGYEIFSNKTFYVAPYLSMSNMSIGKRKDDERFFLIDAFSYGLGLHSELIFKRFYTRNWYGKEIENYLGLKLNLEYKNNIGLIDNNYNGSTPSVNLCFVWGVNGF